MAWRGRGRGRPGGFSRHDITLKADEEPSGVPVAFPLVSNMPQRAPKEEEMDPETLRLLSRYNKMRAAFHNSPFYMDFEVEKTTKGTQPDVQTYADTRIDAQKQVKQSKAALHQVMYLHKTYVPEELFTKEEGKASRKVQSRHAFGADNTAELDEAALSKLVEEDGQVEETKAKDDDSDRDDDGGGGAAEAEADADDDFDRADDDYYQGEHFDDDEEYGAADDDVGEGEAYY